MDIDICTFPTKFSPELKQEFDRIMQNESAIHRWDQYVPLDAERIYNVVSQLDEIAQASVVLRSYNVRYGVTNDRIAYESDGAHTNLMQAMVDRALIHIYGPYFGEPGSEFPRTNDGYSYREIMEAIRQHDLPENVIGDIPDNGDRDNDAKSRIEAGYWQSYNGKFHFKEKLFASRVLGLLAEMSTKHRETGRLLFAADKACALFITLAYDELKMSPRMHPTDAYASARDIAEMKLCDNNYDGYYRASEMWAIDYLRIRKIAKYDDTGFFTAVIVMYTLLINEKWYVWREKDYQQYYE